MTSTSGPRRVQEHLALALVLHEGRRRKIRIDPFGAHGHGTRCRGNVLRRRSSRKRHKHVQAFCTARLHSAGHAGVSESLVDQMSGLHDYREGCSFGRIKIEYQIVRLVPAINPEEGDVVLQSTLIREPEQRAAVVAQRVRHFAPRRFGPDRDPGHPIWGVFGQILLHESRLARSDPDDR